MIKGKTDSGFEFEIDEKKLQDIRFVDALAAIEDGTDLTAVVEASYNIRKVLLGTKQSKKLIAFITEQHKKDGIEEDYIPAEEVNRIVGEIISKAAEEKKKLKNS